MRLGSQSFEPSLNLKRLDLCGLNKEEVVPAIRLMFELLSQSRRGLSAFGDSRRHRKCLEQENEELREQLQNNPSNKRICEAHSISSAASSMTSTSALSP